jgi:hypothetical protein
VTEGSQPPAGVDVTVPAAARMYDFWLGGHDNFAADRIAALKITERAPGTPDAARANRAFLGRAVRYLAGEAGIRQFLDLTEPLAVLFVSALHFVPEPDAHAAVAAFTGAAAPGSHLVLSHGYDDEDPQAGATTTTVYASTASPVTRRTRGEILAFFDGLEILEPGLVPVHGWRPGDPSPAGLSKAWILGGVGRKPA